MDAQQVVDKILSDANAEADKIRQEKQQQTQAEQTRFEQQMQEYQEETRQKAKKTAENKKVHLLAAMRMDIRKEHLAEKRRILDEVFQKAEQQLMNLPDNEYAELMKRLMLNAIETGDEEVIVGTEETRIDERFIRNVNRQLGSEYKQELRLCEEKAAIKGGFILRRGNIKINVSLELSIKQARDNLEIELAGKLFKTQGA